MKSKLFKIQKYFYLPEKFIFMAKPKDLREIVIGHHSNGVSAVKIVELLFNKVSVRTVRRWIQDFILKNKTDRIKSPGRPVSATSSTKITKAKSREKVIFIFL